MNDNGELPEMYKSTVSQIHNFFRFLDPREFGLLIFAYVLPWNIGLYAILWRRQWQPTPVFLPGKSHGRKSLMGCSPWGPKSLTRLSDFTFTFHYHALEKEMATHSSVLAWRIPGTGEPGGLPSMGSNRVRHDWSNLAAAAAHFTFLVNHKVPQTETNN